jgi:RES domain-containing protein
MRFWSICRRWFAADAGTGEGARLYGGRWNSRGVPVVYASNRSRARRGGDVSGTEPPA